jgi:hypothetical protein
MKRLLTLVLLSLLVGTAYAGAQLTAQEGKAVCIPPAVVQALS